jgi:hypothetical protein
MSDKQTSRGSSLCQINRPQGESRYVRQIYLKDKLVMSDKQISRISLLCQIKRISSLCQITDLMDKLVMSGRQTSRISCYNLVNRPQG